MNRSINFKNGPCPVVSSRRVEGRVDSGVDSRVNSLVDAIEKRRTVREFSTEPLLQEQLGSLLWAAQGLSKTAGKRSAPSAGGQYPIQLYVAVRAIDGIAAGLYVYDAEQNTLECIVEQDIQAELGIAAIDEQPWVATAAAIVIVAANMTELNEHFAMQAPKGQRGTRYAYIETGALAQNVHLLASAMNFGMVLVGGFDDQKVKALLKLADQLEATALLCIGNQLDDS